MDTPLVTVTTCTCSQIKLGSEQTEERNWNPDCPAHGTASEWWRSDVQVAQRQITGTRLRVVQTIARLRRQDRIDLEAASQILVALDGSLHEKEN